MALSLGAHTSAPYAASGSTTTSGINTTSGSVIIVGVVYQANLTPPTITDSNGMTWVQLGTAQAATYPAWVAMYKGTGGTRGSGHTFTATKTLGYSSVWVQEVIDGVVDTYSAGVYDTATPYTDSYTNTIADEIILCLVGNSGAPTETYTWSASFVSTGNPITNEAYWQGDMASRTVSAISTYTPSVTTAGGSAAGLCTVGVSASGGGGASVVPVLMRHFRQRR